MMSTKRNAVLVLLSVFLLAASVPVSANSERAEIFINALKGNTFHVSGTIRSDSKTERKNLSFVDSYADAIGLANRIRNPRVYDSNGKILDLKKFGSADYLSDVSYVSFEYDIELNPPMPLITAPHVSWKSGSTALLKMLDMLPELNVRDYKLKLDFPSDLSVVTSEKTISKYEFEFKDPADAVFLIGSGATADGLAMRTNVRQIAGVRFDTAIIGDRQFDSDLVANMIEEILSEYVDLFGSIPRKRLQINLLRFPGEMANDRWRAETQGATITIVSAGSGSKARAEQLLHEQLRHELFHIWIPGALNLKGDYAWFYEGFARYQALKAGVWVGRLRFEDYLRSVAYAIDISRSQELPTSLVSMSSDQWSSGPGLIGARGMSVAFLCDVLMLRNTNGKKSVADLLRGLFNKNAGSETEIAAIDAIEKEFSKHPYLRTVFESNVIGSGAVEWEEVADSAGLAVVGGNGRFGLEVLKKRDRKQKALLNKLGYNRWKKFASRN